MTIFNPNFFKKTKSIDGWTKIIDISFDVETNNCFNDSLSEQSLL